MREPDNSPKAVLRRSAMYTCRCLVHFRHRLLLHAGPTLIGDLVSPDGCEATEEEVAAVDYRWRCRRCGDIPALNLDFDPARFRWMSWDDELE